MPTPPGLDPLMLPRARLTGRAAGAPWAVLSAATGYGKTAAAAQIAAAGPGPVAWCALTEADQVDGGTSRLLAALVGAFPHLGEEPPVADSTGAARLAYALGTVAGPATVVVDDLHLLEGTEGPLVETLRGRTAEADDHVRVVITTEAEPPPTLVRAIAEGRVLLLGPTDLLLDADECAALATATRSALGGTEIAERSGGWPLGAAAIARTGGLVEPAPTDTALAGVGAAAREALQVVALISSMPRDAVDTDAEVTTELMRLAVRQPALLRLDGDRWQAREPLRALLADTAAPSARAREVAERLDRMGQPDTALLLLARLDGDRAALQDRLATDGARLLDAAHFSLVRSLVAHVPRDRRRASTEILDTAAAFGLEQLVPRPDPTGGVDEPTLEAIATRDDLTADDTLALAGLHTELLRRRGDPRLVGVALGALADVGPLDAGAAPLVAGRGPLARRGLFQVLYGVGVAALFSGEEAMIAEGRRLLGLAFEVAEQAGVDGVPLRAQSAYERVAMGLDPASAAVAPLEAGAAALRAVGHPEAANLLVELGDVHCRLGDPGSAMVATAAAADWAERTGNELVLASIALVRAATDLIGRGPSPANDARLAAAWEDLISGPRLRRTAPSIAIRVANVMLDHDDTGRARWWLDRARALVGGAVQRGYQQQYLDSVQARLQYLAGSPGQQGGGDPSAEPFGALPAGRLEARATIAWDHLRRGDEEPARRLIVEHGAELDPPWPARLAGATATVAAGAELRVRMLCAELRVQRNGHPVPAPTGHAARLLALLVLADGAMTVDAAIDDLWPDAEPAAARNRFHQVLHRLRRALGVSADGPLTVVDGVIRLDATRTSSDVWELRTVRPDDRAATLALVRAYESDLCSAQFAYDEAFADARWALSRRLADLVTAGLAGTGAADPAWRDAVRSAWGRLPEGDRLGLALADALEASGGPAEAAEAAEVRARVDARALRT